MSLLIQFILIRRLEAWDLRPPPDHLLLGKAGATSDAVVAAPPPFRKDSGPPR